MQNRINRALAHASLPRIQDDVKQSAKENEEGKSSADAPEAS